MAKPLMMLLKAYKCERWANEFLDGCLYCNTLSFHRKKTVKRGRCNPRLQHYSIQNRST